MAVGYGAMPPSRYFALRDIEIQADEVVAISCGRNEMLRLPYFLEYYRRLGVRRFLFIDNSSTDGTAEYLATQSDVEYFWTDSSYRGSSAGRLWMQELADTYAVDRWTLTLDVDELLAFPSSEFISIPELCQYLEEHAQRGLFTIMLDMYSDRPLSKTVYESGTPFLDVCPYFETDSYSLKPAGNPPFIGVFGGPRDRLFDSTGHSGSRPMMKKIPLVKWFVGFSYIFSTHSHRFVPLSDVTGALLHFKFFSSFAEVAAGDATRGDRRQQAHYETYRSALADDPCFYGRQSIRLESPSDLVRLGVMAAPRKFQQFLASGAGPGLTDRQLASSIPESVGAEGGLGIRSIASIWPFVNNPAQASYFGYNTEPSPASRRSSFYERARRAKVIDVHSDHIVLQLGEKFLHDWIRNDCLIVVKVNGEIAATADLSNEWECRVLEDALVAGLCRIEADLLGAAAKADPSKVAKVSVVVVDKPRQGLGSLRADEYELASFYCFPAGASCSRDRRIDGVVEKVVAGKIHGWVYDGLRDTFDVPVSVYINGRFARNAWPSRRRSDLDKLAPAGSNARGKGFQIDLPLGFFEGESRALRVDVRAATTNLTLRRTPISVGAGVTGLRWDADSAVWVPPSAKS